MKTVQQILTENRESVISSIKFVFGVWRKEDLKPLMIEFFDFANSNIDIEKISTSKRVKTELKYLVQHMSINKKQAVKDASNLSKYGTKNPKLADIMARGNEIQENRAFENGFDRVFCPILKDYKLIKIS
jgi:hypothetical protein